LVPDALADVCARHHGLVAALGDNPAQVTMLRRLGLALWRDGQIADAAAVLDAAVSLQPTDPRLLAELGAVLFAAGRKAEALQALQRSTSLDAMQLQTWINLACLYQDMGSVEQSEDAFRAALMLDASSVQALAGLGLLLAEQQRNREAVHLLAAAVAYGMDDPAVYACLGQTCFVVGEFSMACDAFAKAMGTLANHPPIVRKYAEARLVAGLVSGSLDAAMKATAEIIGNDTAELDDICRRAFQTLCVYGPAEAALRLGEALLVSSPQDAIVTYHMDALRGRPHVRTPDAYLKECFDRFAPKFEHQLVSVLGYRIPELACALLAKSGQGFVSALDLGCGTGLAAPLLKSLGVGELVGVDISPRMLDKARERRLYSRLIEAELLTYLSGSHETFDLVVGLDVVVYFGDLSELFTAVARRMASGGIFAFSYETSAVGGYCLLPTGRFAHGPSYIEQVAGEEFIRVKRKQTTVRLEAGHPVLGDIVLLRRR
jgi:predicted TPR repeat methyltransferase/Flp pilus assembly protein TadD